MTNLSTYDPDVQSWEKDIFRNVPNNVLPLIISEYERAVAVFRLTCLNNSEAV